MNPQPTTKYRVRWISEGIRKEVGPVPQSTADQIAADAIAKFRKGVTVTPVRGTR